MQTFLPFGSDFKSTAQILDRQRLLKQRVETLQIMNVLTGASSGWKRHPAVLMWQGYESALLKYQQAIVAEVIRRGYKDTCLEKTRAVFENSKLNKILVFPDWINNKRLSITHKGNLYRKNPEVYADFESEFKIYREYVCDDRCRYFWPTHI